MYDDWKTTPPDDLGYCPDCLGVNVVPDCGTGECADAVRCDECGWSGSSDRLLCRSDRDVEGKLRAADARADRDR